MALHFKWNYAESVMDTIDRSLILCRERLPNGNAGLVIHLGFVEFLALKDWHEEHTGNVVTADAQGEGLTLFGYPVKYHKEYDSLIQIKGTI